MWDKITALSKKITNAIYKKIEFKPKTKVEINEKINTIREGILNIHLD